MRNPCKQLVQLSLPAIYWLAVTLAPLLHDHEHHLGHSHAAAAAPQSCGHHHCGHSHAAQHHGHSHDHAHTHPHHHHAPGAPLHDDDCGACRFLALKPAPAETVEIAEEGERLPDVVAPFAYAADSAPLQLPLSRGPPGVV